MSIWQKKIGVSTLLKFQLFYCFLGVIYNVVSYISVISGGRQLSSGSPVVGGLFMSFYGLCLVTGYKGFIKTYRLLMIFFLVAIGYGGIVKHFIVYSSQPEAYASFTAWISAIGINLFGFLLNLLAAAGKFEDNEAQ